MILEQFSLTVRTINTDKYPKTRKLNAIFAWCRLVLPDGGSDVRKIKALCQGRAIFIKPLLIAVNTFLYTI